jgi:hemolysin activation/secretion protein
MSATVVHASTSSSPSLAAVVVTGSTAFAPPRLFAAYREQLGAAINRDNALAISNALSGLYLADGYVQPELAIDDSRIADGVLRFNVFEARVTRVLFEGESGRHGDALQGIAARLTAAAPLRRDDIPAALRDMRALPGLSVQASARRDAGTRNGYELVVRTGFASTESTVRVNNRGTEEIGPVFVIGQLFANGLIGHRSKVGLIVASTPDTSEYLGTGLYLEYPLGHSEWRTSALLFGSHSKPHEQPADLNDRYARQRVTLRALRAIGSGSTSSFTFSAGLEADNLRIRRDGTQIRDDQLRIAELALRGSMRSAGSMQYGLNLQLRRGLDGLGAGLEATGLVDDPRRADFLVTQLQFTAARRFAQRWTARVDAFAQYSGQVLPDSECFKIGGDRLGRGFEVAEIAGDRGLGAKLDLRRELFDAGATFGRISAYGFYDIGGAWKENQAGREYAATSGFGIASGGPRLTGYLELAAPVSGVDIEGKRSPSAFAELSWRF